MPNDPNLFPQTPDPLQRAFNSIAGLDARLSSVAKNPKPILRFNRKGSATLNSVVTYSFVATGGPVLILWQAIMHGPTGAPIEGTFVEDVSVAIDLNGTIINTVTKRFASYLAPYDSAVLPFGVEFQQSQIGTNTVNLGCTSYAGGITSVYLADDLRITVLEF